MKHRMLATIIAMGLTSAAVAQEPPRLELVLQTTEFRPVRTVALSGDGKLAVIAGDQAAVLWDTATGKKLQTFGGHTAEARIQCVFLSGDGKQLLTGADDKSAILWDTAAGKKVRTFPDHPESVMSVALSADGKHVVTGSSRAAFLWDAVTGRKLQTFEGHSRWVTAWP